ncbi:MAG: DUF3667 domain-containing protein [Bacteroidetes bacterium]|nr:DUF3667 domain-containing protein [Bacteroidota bacterium]
MIRAEFDPGIGGCSFGTAVITHPNILWPVAEVIEDRSEDEEPRGVVGPEACPNCGNPVEGTYCAACGQKNQPLQQPLHRFIQQAFTEYVGLDGRLWRTFGYLLFRPGRLTVEYLEGRRTRFLRPLRIYLTATILFFFLLSVLDPAERVRRAVDDGMAVEDAAMTVEQRLARISELLERDTERLSVQGDLVDSLSARHDNILAAFVTDTTAVSIPDSLLEDRADELADALDDMEDEEDDLASLRTRNENRRERFEWQTSVLNGYPADSSILPRDLIEEAEVWFPDGSPGVAVGLPDWLPRSPAIRRLNEARNAEERSAALAEFARNTIERLPVVMFLLLPIFALLLKLIYIRRNWFYTEHLVFGLHTHAFVFIVYVIIALCVGFGWGSWWTNAASKAAAFVAPVYFYIAQKRVYGQGWIKTAFKAMMLAWLYGFVLLVGFLAAIALAAALG